MAKTKISEFSSTPANNTDIDSINIAEGCAPSGINDAIRELMSQLKDFQTGAVGDSFNGPIGSSTASTGAFTTLSASGNVTLSGGTANGVAYLNGSKVVTSGSALTFDGNTLTATNTSGNAIIASRGGKDLRISGNYAGANTHAVISTTTGMALAFMDESSEFMRLTSTGLGIGTSSPSEKLEVVGNYIKVTGTTNQVALRATNTGGDIYFGLENSAGNNFNTGTAYAGVVWRSGANPICFVNNSSEKMRLDQSGNLGLGVTPSAWTGNVKAFEGTYGGALSFYAAGNFPATWLSSNAYYNGTNWIAKVTDQSCLYTQEGTTGKHIWYVVGSDTTAGNAITFTQAMTLDASGNLLVGTTDGASSKINTRGIIASSNSQYTWSTFDGYTDGNLYITANAGQANTSNSNIIFRSSTSGGSVTERARIDSSGDLLFGTTSSFAGQSPTAQFYRAGGAVLWLQRGTDYGEIAYFKNYGGTTVGHIDVAASSTAYVTSSDYRLKENIAPMTGALAKIAALKPCSYTWKATGEQADGFIAHELGEVCPHAVYGEKDAVNEDGSIKPQGIDTSFLVATLTAAIQEQQAIIESLKARLDAANL